MKTIDWEQGVGVGHENWGERCGRWVTFDKSFTDLEEYHQLARERYGQAYEVRSYEYEKHYAFRFRRLKEE